MTLTKSTSRCGGPAARAAAEGVASVLGLAIDIAALDADSRASADGAATAEDRRVTVGS
ncbi:MAG: hypothetical protein ACHBNF_04800 [Chromatiales bacterium]